MSNQAQSSAIDTIIDKTKSLLGTDTATSNNTQTTTNDTTVQNTTTTTTKTTVPSTTTPKPFSRLPTSIVPRHYDLSLVPNLTAFTFDGKVAIDVEVTEATNTIVLNVAECTINSASILYTSDNSVYATATHSVDVETEVVTLTASKQLTVGTQYSVVIQYVGILNDKLKGFYRSKYTDSNGVDKYMAVTQFEPTDARRALPCWDEPACKATFTVHISAAKGLTVVSNMPEIKTRDDTENRIVHTFDKTPIMSTYLLAFVVGEFDYVETSTKNGTLLRVYTAVGLKHQGEFALDTGKRALEFYNDYFNIPYPLPKLDQLAIPDFTAGAMENWGCITYRETFLLYDAELTSMESQQRIALVIAHEIAHQWFGNLVTMEWWTHLWLNEGYATWMQYFCVDTLFPQWHIWDTYVCTDYSSTLKVDALANSHEIEIPVGHPSEITAIFDYISYSKGATVIRMLQNYLGATDFQRGMSTYLNKFDYRNALTGDLWNVLGNTSNKPVNDVMTAWTKQVGYPLLIVSEPTIQNNNLVITVKQQRFLSNGDAGGSDIWPVPISFALPNTNASTQQLLHDKEATLTIATGVSTVPVWIKLNAGQTSLYRTLYPATMYTALKQAILSNDTSLHATDRLGLQNDAFALCRAGLLSTAQVLDLMSAYINETEYTVWVDVTSNLNDLSTIVYADTNSESYRLYSQFIVYLYSPIAQKLGWTKQTDESAQTSLLRATVLGQLGKYGDETTIHHACTLFQQYYIAVSTQQQDASTLLSADLRSVVYSIAVAHGGILAYNNALHLYHTATLNEEKQRALQALGSATSTYLITGCLNYAIGDQVRSQDTPMTIVAASQNLNNLPVVWRFIQTNWAHLYTRYGSGYLMFMLVTIFDRFATIQYSNELQQYFSSGVKLTGVERAVAQTTEKINGNVKWQERDGEKIRQWLLDNRSLFQHTVVVHD